MFKKNLSPVHLMKRPSIHRLRQGFTLIELLVVIAIIAILATVSVPVLGTIKKKAAIASAANDARQLENAIKAYYAEYYRYPVRADSEGPYESEGLLLDVLMNNNSAEAEDMNPRGIPYFEASKITNKQNAPGYNINTGRFCDPWGETYEIYMDADDDEELTIPAIYGNRFGRGGRIKKTIFVHSAGPDRKFQEAADNVTSWDS